MALERLPHEGKHRILMALLAHEALEDLTLLVDRAAQIEHAQYPSKLGPKIRLAGGLRPQSSADANGNQTRTIPWFQTTAIIRGSRNGAQKRTRTSTPLRAPAPEAGASTNSAIWARVACRETASCRVGARH